MDKSTAWHPAMNRLRDQTGVAHVLRASPDNIARPICGNSRVYSFGGGFTRAEDGGAHECGVCRRILNSEAKKG